MKVVCVLIITKKYFTTDEVNQTVSDIKTYIDYVEKLVLLNLSGQSITNIKKELARYSNFDEQIAEDKGQVYNYHTALSIANQEQADFGVIMELGYFYDESDFLMLKRYAIAYKDVAVISPSPIFSCEQPSRQDIDDREIKGCHLIGTLININYYKERGFEAKYFQTTFDYEYCLYHRSKGRKIVLVVNAILRNSNYRVIEKRFLFVKSYTYDRDLLDVYYETRNRYYLWDEYQKIDPDYVKLDKKQFKEEVKEMRLKDRNYREKKIMMERAKTDYLKKLTGKKK